MPVPMFAVERMVSRIEEDPSRIKRKGTDKVEDFAWLWKTAEEEMETTEQKKHYSLGQKIPASVKPFNKQEIADR
jgi:hypothetical protein